MSFYETRTITPARAFIWNVRFQEYDALTCDRSTALYDDFLDSLHDVLTVVTNLLLSAVLPLLDPSQVSGTRSSGVRYSQGQSFSLSQFNPGGRDCQLQLVNPTFSVVDKYQRDIVLTAVQPHAARVVVGLTISSTDWLVGGVLAGFTSAFRR